ncbi:MAG: twin transmembrane helix small protein [Rhodopila sp.]
MLVIMHTFFSILLGIVLLSVLGVLAAGMIGMVREGDPRRSNKLMQWRVALQALTILLLVLMMMTLRG